MRRLLCILAAGVGMQAGSARADCRLALALAFDVSRSVSGADYAIQQQGLLDALADPRIRKALLEPDLPVAMALYEWSGRGHQQVVADWTLIEGEADLAWFAAAVKSHQRHPKSLPTALGWALDFGRKLMQDAPDCAEQVLDVSGDGRNNDGMRPRDAYARRDFGDLRVNGLAIGGHEHDVVDYCRGEVIRGPGAFVEVAQTQDDFPAALRRKLLRELSEQVIGLGPAED